MSKLEKNRKIKFKTKDLSKKIIIHKPYPSKYLKEYQIKNILNILIEWRII